MNWFRTDNDGKFLWPGFGENLRVLLWMIDRIKGSGKADETPVGLVPTPEALNLEGLGLPKPALEALLRVDRNEWAAEVPAIPEFYDRFGSRSRRSSTAPSTRWPIVSARRRRLEPVARDTTAARPRPAHRLRRRRSIPAQPEIVVLVSANAEWKALPRLPRDVVGSASAYGEWFTRPVAVEGRDVPVVFFHGGWGKISAAGSTQYAIDRWTPELL